MCSLVGFLELVRHQQPPEDIGLPLLSFPSSVWPLCAAIITRIFGVSGVRLCVQERCLNVRSEVDVRKVCEFLKEVKVEVGHEHRQSAYLEGLYVPALHPLDRRHVAKVMGQLVQLLDSMCQTYR